MIENQRLRGTLQSWIAVFPTLALELKILDLMLSTEDGKWCHPKGTPEELDRLWAEFWDAIEMIMIVLIDPSRWGANFQRPMSSILPFEEQIGVPWFFDFVQIVGADATL